MAAAKSGRASPALACTALLPLYPTLLLLAATALPGAAAAGCPYSAKWMPRALGGLGGFRGDAGIDTADRVAESIAGFQAGHHRRRLQEEAGGVEGRAAQLLGVPSTLQNLIYELEHSYKYLRELRCGHVPGMFP